MDSKDVTAVIMEHLNRLPADQRQNSQSLAKATHAALRECAERCGQRPGVETFYSEKGADGRKTYKASWEAGPYEWAIPASFAIIDFSGRLVEPEYSFDLDFYDVE